MRRAASLLGWFAALEVLWAILIGTAQSTELLAGLGAAALGALAAEALRTQGLLVVAPDVRLAAKAWKLPWLVPFDFAVVTWVLVRSLSQGRRVRGSWVSVPFRTDPGAKGRWQRAFGVATANGAANAIVVDLRDGEAEMHALAPDVFSAQTVL
jgi:hypothetical protein